MNVNQCMKRQVFSVSAAATIEEAAALFVTHHVGTLPVVDDSQQLVGILHVHDLLKLVMPAFVDLFEEFDFVVKDFGAFEELRPTAESAHQPVQKFMEPPVSVKANSGLLRAFAILNHHNLYDLPIVDDANKLVGIASLVDIGSALLTTWQDLA